MVWYDPRSWFASSADPQAEVAAAQAEVDKAQAKLDAAKAKVSGTQQAEALSGPEPPVGGRRHKKTRRAKKGKSRKARKAH